MLVGLSFSDCCIVVFPGSFFDVNFFTLHLISCTSPKTHVKYLFSRIKCEVFT